MNDVLRRKILRSLEALPEEQLYQVADYIEFIASRYNRGVPDEVTPLQRFAERLDDGLRKSRMNPGNLREAFQLLSTADRVWSSVSDAGKQWLQELQGPLESRDGETRPSSVSPVGSPPPGVVGSADPG